MTAGIVIGVLGTLAVQALWKHRAKIPGWWADIKAAFSNDGG